MSTLVYPITETGCVRRGTDRIKGRTNWFAPGNAAVRYLHYGRIILESGDPPVRFASATRETGLICLKGRGTVSAGDQTFDLAAYDSLYIPRGCEAEVTTIAGCDFAEISA